MTYAQVTNDPLQRIYGVAFPDKAMLKQWLEFQEQAKLRDHRTVGRHMSECLLLYCWNSYLSLNRFIFRRRCLFA